MVESLYLQYLFGGFVSLIVITNPLSKIPLFISLTQGMSVDVRKKQANWACYYAAAIMLVSLAAGNPASCLLRNFIRSPAYLRRLRRRP